MGNITVKEAAEKWDISVRRVQTLCNEGKVDGAVLFSGVWAIPASAEKPADHRIKTGKYIKKEEKIGPILKWAGGKTQLLTEIKSRMPNIFNKYIEPFIGGGAVFFDLEKKGSIIADANPELINLYVQIAEEPLELISLLKKYKNEEGFFYEMRAKDWMELSPSEAAARMIYLNRTCFNGLYRLNKKGMFNTPYGRYKNPTICNEQRILLASELLKDTTIVCGDYLDVLNRYASEGDFVFLDPPYVPISEYADFKRYTKEQFYEKDQINLANEVDRLVKIGCKVMLTNSNHPLVHELYGKYHIDLIETKRNINRNGSKRKGEDVIVTTY